MKKLSFIVLTWAFCSCQNSDFEGFERINESLHVRRTYLGDDKGSIKKGDFVSLKLSLRNTSDSLLAIKTIERMNVDEMSLPAYSKEILKKSHNGDGYEFIGVGQDFDFGTMFSDLPVSLKDTMVLSMEVVDVLDDFALRERRAQQRLENDLELIEQQQLARLLDSLTLDEKSVYNGIYVKLTKKGNGKRPQSGDGVRVHYVSTTGSGRVIDNTYKAKPLEYTVGKPDQVLEGFSIGISALTEGAEALLVIPSHLAYGQKGSSSGIVKPFESIVFEVKLEKVGI